MTVMEEIQVSVETGTVDMKGVMDAMLSEKEAPALPTELEFDLEVQNSTSQKSEIPAEAMHHSEAADSVGGISDCLSTADNPEGESVCSTASEPHQDQPLLEVASERGIGSLPVAATELLFAAAEERQGLRKEDSNSEDVDLHMEDWETTSEAQQSAEKSTFCEVPSGLREDFHNEELPATVPGSQECPSPLLPPHSSTKKPSIPSGSEDETSMPLSARSGRSVQATPSALPAFTFTWTATGQGLDALIVPGDILAVNANQAAALSTRLFMGIGTTRGFMGHVMLVTAPPQCVKQDSSEGEFLEAAFQAAPEGVNELWKVRTVESSSSEKGLHTSDLMLFVDSKTNHLRIAGELNKTGTELSLSEEQERVDLWQSPACLRGSLKMDVMQKVLLDMQDSQADWSGSTAIRAVFTSATLTTPPSGREAQMLAEIRSSWLEAPICTSIVVTFWQRYLIMTSSSLIEQGLPDTALPRVLTDLILRYMPVKAHASLPADLVAALENSGWVRIGQVPHLYRGAILASAPFPSQKFKQKLQPPPAATLLRPSNSGGPTRKMTPAASFVTAAGPTSSSRSFCEFPEDPNAEVSV
mmetsp:Transcript_78595/g.163316  ORF Transcript_78595/g.163316 Transcript_78595/m.163316 type:complete len:586 (-) Transcript_78595:27-1784(-)